MPQMNPQWLWPERECTHPPEYRIRDTVQRPDGNRPVVDHHCAACGHEFPASSQPESSQP